MKRILVTGAGGPAANNFIRSLRLAPEPIYIVGTDVNKYYLKLSQADINYLVPPCDEPSYLPTLISIIKQEKIELLHCQPDTELQVISDKRRYIPTKTFLPSQKAIKTAFNKLSCAQLLRKNRIDAPYSLYINDHTDIKHAIEVLTAKGHKKFWVRAIKGAGSRAALPVTNYEQAKMWIDYWHNQKDVKYGQFMMCEYLPGK